MPTHASDWEATELFEQHVRPTLIDQCLRCHGEKKQQGGLRLDSRAALLAGGDSGPAIVPGKPDESLLIRAIRYQSNDLEMPPKGILPKATIAALEKWVALGAPDPRVSDPENNEATVRPPTVEQGRDFWSFQPIGRPKPAEVDNKKWPVTDIDHFVLARLEQQGVQPVADADPTTLIRRVYFDLIGLPPTPEQIEAFVSDTSPIAYSDLIDSLIDSPQFGQRWGRHWLDVVRFAESSGGGRTLLFPDAWRYRDYVIDSFNRDVPYDQFLREQIAGDLLDSDGWEDRRRKLIATAFLLLGPTNYELQDKDILEMDVVDEQLDTIGKGMLGMTIGCARCHDHKFDPIPTRDYYAMAGILKSTKAMIHSNVSQWNTVGLPLEPQQEAAIQAHQERLTTVKAKLAQATKAWKEAGGAPQKKTSITLSVDPQSLPGIVIDDDQVTRIGKWTESTSIGGYVGSRYIHDGTADKGQKSVAYRLDLPTAGRYEVQVSYTASSNRSSRVPVHIHHLGGETVIKVNQKRKPKIKGHLESLGSFEFDPEVGSPRIVISNEGTEDGVVIADAVVLISADTPSLKKRKGEAADSVPATVQNPGNSEDEHKKTLIRRLKAEVDALAKQIKQLEGTAPKRPVAMATGDDEDAGDIHVAIRGVVHNRGPITPRGVLQVASTGKIDAIPDGQSGRRELADWISSPQNPLTARVMANRIWYWLFGQGIVPTVDNFGSMGQSPTHPELLDHLAGTLIDNGWSVKTLIRQIMHSRVYRLATDRRDDAIRVDPENHLLWRMNRKRLRAEDIRDALLSISGELDHTHGGSNIKPGTKSEYGYQFQSRRRSVYVPVFRNTLPELFEVFDFADPNIPRGKRVESTIASQALLMMNHPFVIEQSDRAAARLLKMGPDSVVSRVHRVYLQVLGRPPSDKELSIAVDFMASASQDERSQTAWAMLYQSLFQSVDFRYLN